MRYLKPALLLILALFAVALVLPTGFDDAFAQRQNGESAGRKGGGGGGARSRGGSAAPVVRSAPSAPRITAPRMTAPSSRPAFTPRVTGERRITSERRSSRPPSVVRTRPPVAARPAVPSREASSRRSARLPVTEGRHRPWRRGLRWRWIAVPTVIFAGELNWCHYHAWRAPGMVFHRDVRCHRHAQWDHPSLRYVEGY